MKTFNGQSSDCVRELIYARICACCLQPFLIVKHSGIAYFRYDYIGRRFMSDMEKGNKKVERTAAEHQQSL